MSDKSKVKITALDTTIKAMSSQPGVYLMKSKSGTVLYVGKAKNLKKRVSSYFKNQKHARPLTRMLVDNVASIDTIVTTSEKEALLLERSLIQKESPKYNIIFRDDKDYLSLRLSIQHQFPRLTVVRKPKRDGAHYFGPYASALNARKMARYLYRLFPLRSCSDSVLKNRKRPCILYQINLCTAPCVDKIDKDAYDELVEQMRLFLKGNNQELIKRLQGEMKRASQAMDYDNAALLRDRIQAIEISLEEQLVTFHDMRDVDVIGTFTSYDTLAVVILTVRKGRVVGKRELINKHIDEDHIESTIETMLVQHYLDEVSFIPPEIYLPEHMHSRKILEEALNENRSKQIRMVVPKKGEKKRMVNMAMTNAKNYFDSVVAAHDREQKLMERIQSKFKLENPPERIEAYDISTMQGRDSVGGQVTFIHGKPARSEYRRYKIKTIEGQNDFAMLQEVLKRRLSREGAKPDFILIDGGKGQLSSANKILQELNISIPVASIAKVPVDKEAKGIETDRIFVPKRRNPLSIKAEDPVLKLFQAMRDEVHRTAIQFHKKQALKRTVTSELLNIPGVGKKRMQKLLSTFGSVAGVKKASDKELAEVVPRNCVEVIRKHFDGEPA